MKTHPKTPLAVRALIAGIVIVGLPACQPVINIPGTALRPVSPASPASPAKPTTTAPVDPTNPPKSATTAPTTTAVKPTTTTTASPTTTAAPTTTTTASPTTTAAPTTTTTASPTTTAAPTSPTGWKLIGGDEFNASALNTSKWKPYYSNYGSSNLQLECNTPNNVSQSGGTLKIVAKKQAVSCPSGGAMDYTSGFIGSRETGTYYPKFARFEMRAKVPHAQGLWPAFWLRHRNGAGVAEVDIMEYFHSQVPGRATQTLHLDGVSNISKKTTTFENPASTPGFHVWAVEITPDPAGVRFAFFVDDVEVLTFVDTKNAWAKSADPAGTWDIALNMAVGGRWVGAPDGTLGLLDLLNRCSIGGTAPGGCSNSGIKRVNWSSASSTTFDVDYVRVYTPTS